MNTSESSYSGNYFSHIYIEKEAEAYPVTKDILARFKASNIISIGHYKDIFNRPRQNFALQKQAPSLILAVKHGELIYPGAVVCQSFGNEHFYYTSNVMNCLYDCEYCYLQGMYPSGNVVIFVNLEDIFRRTDELLKEHSVYMCISYDTDLMALDGITGFISRWCEFAAARPDLKIEIRTKSARLIPPSCAKSENIIFAWTLSPDEIIGKYEHRTPALSNRLKAIRAAKDAGYTVRLCFDPLIHVPDYDKIYAGMFRQVFSVIDGDEILDCSLGLFRISADYLKKMRNSRQGLITSYPYTNTNGVCSYDEKKSREILNFAESELTKYVSSEKIYTMITV